MIRRLAKRSRNDAAPGEDSFLDIVANLVGVLIILLVVVGANAGSRLHEIAISEVDQAETEKLKEEHQATARNALNLEHDNHQLENRIDQEKQLVQQRQAERNQMLVRLATARQELDQRKQNLTNEHQTVIEQTSVLAELREEFRNIDSQYTSLDAVADRRETIEHFPTPIAKTVFTDEIHFRISGGRIVYVPMNELVELMRDEWKEKARKLEVADETTETVGPIDSFRLQYQLRAEEHSVETSYGNVQERVTRFTRFVMVPVSEQVGAPLEEALLENSQFRSWLQQSSPDKTTVSIWVYPDSFSEFNQLKKWLYKRGYKTACWPLSKGNPISGGPSGYRSTSQ